MEIGGDSKLLQEHLVLPKSSGEWIFGDEHSDFTVEVCGEVFALHKVPLASKSGRIRKFVAEHEESKMELINLPGGAESFKLAAKFCYGIEFEIKPSNVAQLWYVSEFLEMNEEFSNDTLQTRAEKYLDNVVCEKLELCVEVLRQCESLLPLADELRIVDLCIDTIASTPRVEHMDLSALGIEFYKRVITDMKRRGAGPERVVIALVDYVSKQLRKVSSLWNISEGSRDNVVGPTGNERLVIETIVCLFPKETLVVPINILFRLLRSAVMYKCSFRCKANLERRIGNQLDLATVDDLLILSFSEDGDSVFDFSAVTRILDYFQQHEYDLGSIGEDETDGESESESESPPVSESESPRSPSQTPFFKVAKLVDSYLAVIASDADLELHKFMAIAESVPAYVRTVHDGLYRAIDVYLQAHQGLSEAERRRICMLIDFEKLSQPIVQAHAAMNQRLDLQPIVQGLYFEQRRLRKELFCLDPEEETSWRVNSGAACASMTPKNNCAFLRSENRELKLELARLRTRLDDLERDHVSMKRRMEKTGSHTGYSSD